MNDDVKIEKLADILSRFAIYDDKEGAKIIANSSVKAGADEYAKMNSLDSSDAYTSVCSKLLRTGWRMTTIEDECYFANPNI